MKDVMLDLETLGNGMSKCICQIGAVYFDRVTGELGQELKINVDARSHIRAGGVIDAETVYWWMAQSDAARASILADPKVDIHEAFRQLNEFLAPSARVWSHATFDFVTIMDTFKQLNMKPYFSYKNGMDIRTLTFLSGLKVAPFVREGTQHDALDDCKYQVKYCVASLNAIKESKLLMQYLERVKA